jgi:xylulokinase
MAYIATFDVGTTAVKAVLVSVCDDVDAAVSTSGAGPSGIVASASVALQNPDVGVEGGEQHPEDWWKCFLEAWHLVLEQAYPEVQPKDVSGIVLSGQMQDLILVDTDGRPLRPAILYSDGRADEESAMLAERYGERSFRSVVGNRCEGSLPLPKLMWVKAHEPEIFARTAHVLFDAKDYIISRLTGDYIGDVTACSTAGAMNIHTRQWDAALLEAAGVGMGIFPELHVPQDQVGSVDRDISAVTSFAPGTAVYAGIGDAGATTLASGVSHAGQYNINIGTSGWIAGISQEPLIDVPGVANLACATPGGFINGVPFLNAGNIHRWAARTFAAGGGKPDVQDGACGHDTLHGEDRYRRMSELLAGSVPGSHGVLCLPYFAGERFPVMDTAIRGSFVGLGLESTLSDMVRASLEGVAFSLRQGMERFDGGIDEITLIGGGAREELWCQILADVLGHDIEVFDNAEFMPAVALAYLVQWPKSRGRTGASADDETMDFNGLMTELRRLRSSRIVTTHAADAGIYERAYADFRKLYPALSSIR